MAVATQAARGQRDVKTYIFNWEGVDKNNKTMRGDLRAASETVVTTTLRRQGIRVIKVKRLSLRGGGRSLLIGCARGIGGVNRRIVPDERRRAHC